jgi:hypothetical protein
MPFKSKAQRRLFYLKERRGELPEGTTARWEKETSDKKLPEKMNKKAGIFWEAFFKKAAEEVVVVPPEHEAELEAPASLPQPQRLMKWNALGGVDSRTPEEMQRAQSADLVTLPKTVEAANCGNCEYFNPVASGPTGEGGFCSHEAVMQGVSQRMCCAHWDAPGTYRAWEVADAAQVVPSQVGPDGMPVEMPVEEGQLPLPAAGPQVASEGGEPGGLAPAAEPEAVLPPEVAAAPEAEAAPKPAEPKKKPSSKKDSAKAGPSTININLGHSKKASLGDLLR